MNGFTLIELMIVVAIVGVLATLAIFGVAQYLKHARSAEATNALGRINEDSVMAYDKERTASMIGAGSGGGNSNQLCPSSTGAIPSAPPKGAKYTADPAADYVTDPGFSCLGFTMNQPQVFAYDYVLGGPSKIASAASVASLTGWGAGAVADFDADGTNFVEFATGGNIVGGVPVTATNIASWDMRSKSEF